MVFTPAQLAALRAARPEDYTARLDDCARHGVNVLTWADEDYPDLLRAVSAPPPVLYYRGDAGIPNRCFTFAIVGTRRPSAYGVEATASIAGELARAGVALVSGLATGLDSESHKAAVQAGAPTVACIAFGHDQCYPAANRTLKGVIERQGLVLSEYPPGTPPQRGYFLQRNRLIAGLSRGLCVAEARRRSGTMNTVAAALAAGRDVFSVPGSIFSPLCEGTNQLLREGAVPAVSGADILLWYGLARPEQPEKAKPDGAPLSLDAQRMRDALSAAALSASRILCASRLSGAPSGFAFSGCSGRARPYHKRISAPDTAGTAPSRRSWFVPSHSGEKILPGTLKTSLPAASAAATVFMVPERRRASATQSPRDSPAMSRLRCRK